MILTTFYLVRHGEPDWVFKEERNLSGALRDFVPLTENGIEQAEQVVLRNSRLTEGELIISSPYTRSVHTAAIINRRLNLPFRVEYDLHEWTPDNFQAESIDEIKELWDDFMHHDGCHPIGESRLWETKESVLDRVNSVFCKYLDKSSVIVVCHGMVIGTLLGCSSEDVELCGVYEFSMS